MTQCVALKSGGTQCTQTGVQVHDGLCGIHHNQKMRKDPVYAARFQVVAFAPGVPPHMPDRRQEYVRLNRSVRGLMNKFMDMFRVDRPLVGIELRGEIHNYIRRLDQMLIQMRPLHDADDETLRASLYEECHTIRREYRRIRLLIPLQGDGVYEQLLQLNHQPMVFARDPEGSVDLRAFGEDRQSVHRSSVQAMAEAGLKKLLERVAEPLPSLEAVCDAVVAHLNGETRESTIENVRRSYAIVSAFGISYKLALDCLWTLIQTHKWRDELVLRLVEELHEGIDMCSNGQMARLVNVLQGFEESAVPVATRDAFQAKMAMLSTLPLDGRESAAHEAFSEYGIPPEEQSVWLETLLEA